MVVEIRVLSVRQPWAWALFHAEKRRRDQPPDHRVENRAWAGCKHRGPLALHAAKGCTRQEYASAVTSIGRMRADLGLGPVEVPPLAQLPRGGLVGICRVVGATRHADDFELDGFGLPGALGIELADLRSLPFVPLAGSDGIFSLWLAGLPHATEYAAAWVALGGRPATVRRDEHRCHASGCFTPCPPERLMCLRHWRLVPRTVQHEVWRHCRQGQCDDKRPSDAWCRAADAAIAAVALAEGRDITPGQAGAAHALGLRHERINEKRQVSLPF